MRAILVALLILSGCRNEQPAGPTSEQAAQLNDAETMLNAAAANEEGPEANGNPSK